MDQMSEMTDQTIDSHIFTNANIVINTKPLIMISGNIKGIG